MSEEKKGKGLVLTPRIAESIWKQEISWVLQADDIPALSKSPVYLCDSSMAYGIISLNPPEKITPKEFALYQDHHGCSNEDRQKWWPKKNILHAYRVRIEEAFPEPMPVAVEDPSSTMTEVTLRSDDSSTNIKAVVLKELDNKQLIFHHALIHRFYTLKMEGKMDKLSIEDLFDQHTVTVSEMRDRGLRHTGRDDLDKIDIPSLSKELGDMGDGELLRSFWAISEVL